MLVDDEPMGLDLTKEMLEMLGYGVTGLSDAADALKRFTKRPHYFDLAIIDYGMPIMNGKQFANRLKEVRADIPLILFTGYGELVAHEMIKTWAFDALLLKPVGLNELGEVVREVLSKRAADETL